MMRIDLYRMTCLTNLHMGSGDVNYSVVDLQVERDPVLGEPTMNSSGVKGALRAFCEETPGADAGEIVRIFGGGGTSAKGAYKFFSGDLLARPVRVSRGDRAYVMATTPELVNTFLRKLSAFGAAGALRAEELPSLDNGMVCSAACREIEGLPAVKAEKSVPVLETLLGRKDWVLMDPLTLANIDLPVTAHNVLENGESKNLWYEEVVPHESVFLLMVGRPAEDAASGLDAFLFPNGESSAVVQFGAGASTGTGYMLLEKIVPGGA